MSGSGSLFGAWLGGVPPWEGWLGLLAHGGAGFAIGTFYFQDVWRSARRLAAGGGAATAIVQGLVRLGLLALVLALTVLEGALPLLFTALGVVLARPAVRRRIGGGGR